MKANYFKPEICVIMDALEDIMSSSVDYVDFNEGWLNVGGEL